MTGRATRSYILAPPRRDALSRLGDSAPPEGGGPRSLCAIARDLGLSQTTLCRWQRQARRDPLSGDIFVFVGKTRKRAMVLWWDGTGLCLLCKRLEKGRFVAPWHGDQDEPLRWTMSELALFLEGSQFAGRVPSARRRGRPPTASSASDEIVTSDCISLKAVRLRRP